MAHQTHNVPWNTVASHLKFIEDSKQYTPPLTDFVSKNLESQTKDIAHFVRRFTTVIQDFASTERKKYSEKPAIQGKYLYDASLLQDAVRWSTYYEEHHYEATRLQSNWKMFCEGEDWPSRDNAYNDAAALLLVENKMEPLLVLARMPGFDLTRLDRSGGNYMSPLSFAVESALLTYVYFNILWCRPEVWNDARRPYQKAQSFRSVLARLDARYGGEFVHLLHRKYLQPQGGLPPEEARLSFDPFADFNRLHAYLKECFNYLVRYEVFAREAGQDPGWSNMLQWCLTDSRYGFFRWSDEELKT